MLLKYNINGQIIEVPQKMNPKLGIYQPIEKIELGNGWIEGDVEIERCPMDRRIKEDE